MATTSPISLEIANSRLPVRMTASRIRADVPHPAHLPLPHVRGPRRVVGRAALAAVAAVVVPLLSGLRARQQA